MNVKTKVQTPEQEIAARPATDTAISTARDNFGWSPGLPSNGSEGERLPRSMASDIRLKYVSVPGWTANGKLCNDRELVGYDKTYSIVRWSADNMPAEIIPVMRGALDVDLASLNAKVPRTEWRMGLNGSPEQPYQLQRVLEFVDPVSMERLSWPHNVTVKGSSRAADELEGHIMAARRLRGGDLYPLVKLKSCFMDTMYGGRERPHFEVSGWVRLSEQHGIERVVTMQNETAAVTDATKQ